MLGYDLDVRGGKLLVNEAESEIVLRIFRTFLKERSLLGTLYEVDSHGWKSKAWVTRTGKIYGGKSFTRHTLEFLLSNPLYIGKVRLKGELHPGEHTAIVDLPLWTKVNKLLAEGRRRASSSPSGPLEAILRGLLFCGACASPMVPTYTLRRRTRVRYYACLSAQKRGWRSCPSGRVPAQAIEASVLERIGAGDVTELVERITFDGGTREVAIKLRSNNASLSEGRA